MLTLKIGKKYPAITGSHTDSFVSELNKAMLTASSRTLVLDLEGTSIVGSTALGAIFSARQKLREQGKALRIVNASEKVARLLQLVNMDDLIT